MRAYLTIVLIFISSLAKAQLPKDITFYYKNYSLLLSYDNKVRGPFLLLPQYQKQSKSLSIFLMQELFKIL